MLLNCLEREAIRKNSIWFVWHKRSFICLSGWEQSSFGSNWTMWREEQTDSRTENWDARGLKLRLKWKLLLLTNWWVSAVWETSASRCICLPRLSVSYSIVVFFLSMPDLQLHPHGPNDNAAGKKEASWRERSEWKDPKSQLSLPSSSSPFTLFPLLLMSAGLDSPGEIKPVCNAALPLHVCVFTTWPHRCGACLHSSVCGLPPLNICSEVRKGVWDLLVCPWPTASHGD